MRQGTPVKIDPRGHRDVGQIARPAVVAAIVMAMWGGTCRTSLVAQETESPDRDAATIRLVVDYGDGVERHFTQIRNVPPMTVWSVLQQASDHPRGIKTVHRGRDDRLIVTAIDDLKNEGGTGRNWIYRVNGKLADRSAGIHPVQSGDTILWRFQTYR